MSTNFMNSVKLQRASRSNFDLSHSRKFSMQMGELTPTLVLDCVPGDRVTLSTQEVFKLAPMVAPIMHQVNVKKEYFNVPLRLLWNNFSEFIVSAGQPTYPQFPFLSINFDVVAGTLADYMGIPIGDYGTNPAIEPMRVSALPFAAYVCMYSEYYRDQNLMPEMNYQVVDGNNNLTVIYTGFTYLDLLQSRPLNRCWEKDIFTSALPFKQKGPAVVLDLGTSAPVNYIDDANTSKAVLPTTGAPAPNGTISSTGGAVNVVGTLVGIDNSANLEVDLSNAQSATIESWRESMVLQRFLERNAVAGTRYTEFILAMFGVKSSDSRLQRPEYLGGNSSPFAISEVLQTSETTGTSPQAGYSGHGVSVSKNRAFSYEQEEYSLLMGVVTVIPETAYFQGLHKSFTKFDPLDYLNAMFAHLGEEAVYTKEVYALATDAQRETVFGYQRKFYDYCQRNSTVHGEFATTQDFWHMAQKYGSIPVLNEEFVKAVPTRRIFADTSPSTDTLYCQMWHNIDALRQLPKYGTPM